MLKIRLLPAVAGGAAALLLLKGIDLMTSTPYVPQTISAENPGNSPFTAAILRGKGKVSFGPGPGGADAPRPAPQDPETTGSTAAAKPEEKKPEEKKPEPALPPQGTPVKLDEPAISPAERGLLQKLGERREQLDDRQRELEMRENLLKAADKKLEERINELKQLEASGNNPDGTSKKDPTEQQQLKNLVTMYEAMKPKDAARVFDRLSLAVLVPVVNAMNPRKMSEILAAMTPEAAEKLTVELAGGAKRSAGRGGAGTLPAGELQAIDPKRP
jgi:flagellar motility protein MotE (MotC chaperone)